MTEKQAEFLQLAVIKKLPYVEIETVLGIKREVFSSWWNEFKTERDYLTLIRDKWQTKCPQIEFDKFKSWFETTPKHCHYCKLTEQELSSLWLKYPDLTKRNRGRGFEIDRLKPNESYELTDNLVFACYWCNNAKTDTFTEEEFKKVGELFSIIWKERLK